VQEHLDPNDLFQLTGADHVGPAPVDVLRRADHGWLALLDSIPILPVRDLTSSLFAPMFVFVA